MHQALTSSMIPHHIAGVKKITADIISRAFKLGQYFEVSQRGLVPYFNAKSPLTQQESWTKCRVPSTHVSSVIACLRDELLPVASLLRQTPRGKSTGHLGKSTPPQQELAHTSIKTVPPIERDLVAGAFAARVWTGEYGKGQRIRAGGLSEALAVVSKTIEPAGQPSALYRGDNKYHLFPERES